jgi:hypothetical protein
MRKGSATHKGREEGKRRRRNGKMICSGLRAGTRGTVQNKDEDGKLSLEKGCCVVW